jgi:hypothetical protein
MKYTLFKIVIIIYILILSFFKLSSQLSVSIEILDTLSCAGIDGALRAEVSGGDAPYNFLWHGPNNFVSDSQDIYGLYNGTYYVIVTDSSLNEASDSIELTGQLSMIINIIDTLTCYGADGTINIIPVGGVPGYTVTWTRFPLFYHLTAPYVADTIYNMVNGRYNVKVTDGNGCEAETTFINSYPAAEFITGRTFYYGDYNIRCYGENSGKMEYYNPFEVLLTYRFMSLDSVLDTTFQSNADTITFDSLYAGVYLLSHTNIKGCRGDLFETLTEPEPISITFTNIDSVCTGQKLTISPLISGGMEPYNYLWNTGEDNNIITDTLFADKTYSLTVTDSNGCIDSARVNVTVYTPSFHKAEELFKFRMYPNPVDDFVYIEYELTKASYVKIDIVDINGIVRKSFYYNRQFPGFYSINFNLKQSGINPGMYIMRFNIDREIIYKNIFITN